MIYLETQFERTWIGPIPALHYQKDLQNSTAENLKTSQSSECVQLYVSSVRTIQLIQTHKHKIFFTDLMIQQYWFIIKFNKIQ